MHYSRIFERCIRFSTRNKQDRMLIILMIFSRILSIITAIDLPIGVNYNDYGMKIAMNEFFMVKVQNEHNPPSFLIQFAPYNSSTSLQCMISNSTLWNYYIYTVVLAKNQTEFFFTGEYREMINETIIGVVKYDSNGSTCDTRLSLSSRTFSNYEHQEYYIIAARLQGRLAYGFSNRFLYIYDSQNNSIVSIWDGNSTWPHSSFMPHAIDLSKSFGVLAGFILNPLNTAAKYVPIIYLINFSATDNRPMVVDSYLPNATLDTWQDLLTNADADFYSAKYDMSVGINEQGQILVGMQFMNRIFFLSVNLTNPIRLNYTSRNTGLRSIGNGKSVVWLEDGMAGILVNTYTLSYQWLSSKIFFYDIRNSGFNTNSTPLSVFPSNHQLLPINFSPVFVSLVSSPSTLALLDNQGNILLLNPTPPGYFPFVQDTRKTVAFTYPQQCLVGRYKNQSGIHDCLLCPTGTKNSGNSSLACLPCSPGSFCPLGAVSEVPYSAIATAMQVLAYPKSPESVVFDDILMENMFQLGPKDCLRISPLFWTLIMATCMIIIIVIMGILKVHMPHPRSKQIRTYLKWFFKHTDLINEGEFWLGGLASFCVIVLVSFGYAFSAKFLKQYPIETASDSHFACDVSLRNAQFETSIQSSSIPAAKLEQTMIDLLDNQSFTLNVAFVNTLMKCDVVSLQALYGTTWTPIRYIDCYNNNSVLSISIALKYQKISVQIFLADVQSIGGLRVGLYGSPTKLKQHDRKALDFHQGFGKSGEILAQNLPILLELTKVINETLPLVDDDSQYNGIYIPTFAFDTNSLFLPNEQYIQLNSTSTTFTIEIRETPYYVKNVQRPIAKTSEIIFHNFLFTTVCLEIFGLGFLLFKLVIKPLCVLLCPKQFQKKRRMTLTEDQIRK